MKYRYPTPQSLGIRIPPPLRAARFSAGFRHALRGGHLTDVRYLRLSFRLGFRTAKLYLRELRRQRGIREFPLRGRILLRAVWPEALRR